MEIGIIVLLLLGVAIFLYVEGDLPIAPSTTVQAIAKAVARAEGFYAQGSVPQRANNPGDLELGDIGYGTIAGKTIYSSPSQGWSALYRVIEGWLDGTSKIYGPDWTIADIANTYTGGDNAANWAQNVADSLGVGTDTPIGQVSA